MAQKPSPVELNKHDPESLYNWIAYKVSCPEFRNPIKNFIDENCSTFVDIDENSFEQGQLFNEMNLLIENLLKDVLEQGQITQEDFLKAAERGITDKKYKKYFNQIINFGDYTFFKSVMTKRNYQIIQMAEKEMNQEKEKENNQQQQIPPEIIAEMLANEQSEINEAIKQSLAEEDEKRRIAIIEEEEMKRAIKQSLEQAKKEGKKEEPKKEEQKKEEQKKKDPKKEEAKKEGPKKEETKKEEPKKEEPKKEKPEKEEAKKFIPTISTIEHFQYSGEEIPKENKPNPTIISSNQGIKLQVSSRVEEFGVKNKNESKNEIRESSNPAPTQIEETKSEPPKKIEKKEEKKPEIIFPKKEERITRDFINIFEEKKMTLAPLIHKSNAPIKSSLKVDLEKNQKSNVQKNIEKMKKKSEEKNESAKDIIKSSLMQSTNNKNDINYLEDDGGLLIDEDEDDFVPSKNDNKDNSKSNNIHFGRIAIPQNFNDKIPDYNKEKQEQLKEYREKVLKMKKDEREQKLNYQ